MTDLHKLAADIAAGRLDPNTLPHHPAVQTAPAAAISQLLDKAMEVYLRQPHAGRGLAAVAWAAVQSNTDTHPRITLGDAALTYGRTLVRAEHPQKALQVLDIARTTWTKLGNQEHIALCNWQIGAALRIQGHFPKAVKTLTSAARQLAKLGNRPDAARCWRELAVTLNLQGHADLAGEPLEAARAIFKAAGDDVELARCRLTNAARLQWQERFEEAVAELQTALPVLEKANLLVEQGIAHYIAAFLHMRRDTLQETITHLHQARHIFRQVNITHRLARCDNVLGGAYLRSLRPREAIPHLEAAAMWFKEHNVPVECAWCQANLGAAYYLSGRYSLARQKIKAALPLFQAAGQTAGATNAQMQLGAICHREGRLEEGLAILERAWHSWQQINRPLSAAPCAFYLATTYQMLGQRDKAMDWLQTALNCYQAANSTIGLVRTQLEMSQLYVQAGQLDRARELATVAHRTAQASKADLALCERRLGEIAVALDDWAAAARHFTHSADTFSKMGMAVSALESRIAWGDALRHTDPAAARRALKEAQNAAANQHLPDLAWRAAVALAKLAREAGDLTGELGHLEAARRWLATTRRRLTQPTLAGSYLAGRLPALERGLTLALKLQRPESALFFNDETRSQALAVQLHHPPLPQPPPDDFSHSLATGRRELLAELRMLERELRAESSLQPTILFSTRQADLMLRHQDTAVAYNKVCAQLERAGRRGQVEPADVAIVDPAQLQETGWDYLAYHWQDNLLTTFVITPDTAQAHRQTLTSLDRMAVDMCASPHPQRRALTYRLPGAPLTNPAQSWQQLRQLYNLLIPPQVAAQLQPDRPLVIVPHGPLYSLPFSALLNAAGRPLVEQTAITYAPSLALLQTLVRQREPCQAGRALVVGIQEFNGRHPELAHARQEATAVANSLDCPATLLLDKQATAAELQVQAGRYRLIHLATHGFADPHHGRLAGIALANRDLWLNDLPPLGLSAPLVVLSACETGLGIGQTGDQVGGVAGVFFALGAQTVVATLWSADDPTTASIIKTFYRALRGSSASSASPAVALAQAQRQHLHLPPYHWASLACFGLP